MSNAKKMTPAEQTAIRNELYGTALAAISDNFGYETEQIDGGSLVHLGNGQYAQVKIVYKDPEKFSLEAERQKFAEKQAKAAEREAERTAKALERKAKADAKAAAAAKKAAETTEDAE